MTEDVVLRNVVETDLPIFFEFGSDPVALHMAAFTAKDPSNVEAFNDHWKRILSDKNVITRTILLGEHVVGSLGSFVDEAFGKREVTYWIGREYWGRGFATIALSRFLRELKARPIYARASADNIGSIRVLEKCGFKEFSRARGFANARGKEIEEVILELTT